MTFGELNSSSNSLARALQSRGIVNGKRVCIFMQNSPEFVIAHFAFAGKKIDVSSPIWSLHTVEIAQALM